MWLRSRRRVFPTNASDRATQHGYGLEEDQVKAPSKHRGRLAKAQKPRTPHVLHERGHWATAIAEAIKSSVASMFKPVWKLVKGLW